jgi:hypothetical protein
MNETIEDAVGYNSAYISLNLLDELDFYFGGYGKPNVEFIFSVNTFVETFIGSSEFYTSLDELNHLNITAPALFPNGRPILNLVVREGGLKFVNGIVDNPGQVIYEGDALTRTKKEAQQDFIIEYGKKIHDRYFIKSDITNIVEKIPLITSKFVDDVFIVSEVLSSSLELVSNLINVANTSSIQTTLPIYLYDKQVAKLSRTPYSIESLDRLAKIYDANLNELKSALGYRYLPIPPFTNILLSQVNSISEIPQKLTQLRADFQELRDSFVELEHSINEASSVKEQMSVYKKFSDFWATFNKKYVEKNNRIFWGHLDLANGGDVDKSIDSAIDGNDPINALKDINAGKIAGNLLRKAYEWNKDRRVINRFKGLTNIWELFQNGKNIVQQLSHFERLFSVKFSNSEISKVHEFVQNKLTNITSNIE